MQERGHLVSWSNHAWDILRVRGTYTIRARVRIAVRLGSVDPIYPGVEISKVPWVDVWIGNTGVL